MCQHSRVPPARQFHPPPTTSMVMHHEAVKGLGQMQIPLFSDTASHGEGLRGRAGARQACHVGTQGEYHLAAKLGLGTRNAKTKKKQQKPQVAQTDFTDMLAEPHRTLTYRTCTDPL